MNPVYSRAKLKAQQKLRQYGVPVSVTNADDAVMSGYGVLLDSETSDAQISTNTKKVLFAPLSIPFKPTAGDIVAVKDANWAIVSVEDINPDGSTTILFKMMVAK